MFEGPEPGSREYRELTHLLCSRSRKRRHLGPIALVAVAVLTILAHGGVDAICHL
jgi:hypothetical protein